MHSQLLDRLANSSPLLIIYNNSEQEETQWSHHLWEQCGLHMSLRIKRPNTASLHPPLFDLSPEPRAPSPDL